MRFWVSTPIPFSPFRAGVSFGGGGRRCRARRPRRPSERKSGAGFLFVFCGLIFAGIVGASIVASIIGHAQEGNWWPLVVVSLLILLVPVGLYRLVNRMPQGVVGRDPARVERARQEALAELGIDEDEDSRSLAEVPVSELAAEQPRYPWRPYN